MIILNAIVHLAMAIFCLGIVILIVAAIWEDTPWSYHNRQLKQRRDNQSLWDKYPHALHVAKREDFLTGICSGCGHPLGDPRCFLSDRYEGVYLE